MDQGGEDNNAHESKTPINKGQHGQTETVLNSDNAETVTKWTIEMGEWIRIPRNHDVKEKCHEPSQCTRDTGTISHSV
ncbi:hypothetical protein MJO28_001230 [Puccinia striiformis f. sp. tritici]|uniref:Uncharacterized protein n=1 Tax=Puccinia striiformis f. sp. tritici TaxID=168172 RepID=A0ACC0F0M9_9BASI|nr:hypothetical protein MJO28_001230 [Puccinia striiformis f. sp. tritici]KAI7966736.1 hypothetical protein MJO29_000013 [Puccinia striiformis f. sp. tritici]